MTKQLLLAAFIAPFFCQAQYTGSGSVTQGTATTLTANLYTCGRTPGVGTITATDNSVWTVPAVVNFTSSSFPAASNLHNPCVSGAGYANTPAALAALSGTDIVTIDATGEVITAYVFADNYFEMYINGVPVGKDNVPYTQFNSSIVRFKVNRPFTIAMLLVDWEENLGLGSENNNNMAYYPGDGGLVAVFKNAAGSIVAATGSSWKAQTYYTSPVTDLTCPAESGTSRLSANCSTVASNNGSGYYGIHWSRPANWSSASFNDSSWPNASVYSTAAVGVNNKSAYTNFTDVFDDPSNDAQFIWSTNLILDNEVIVRHTVSAAAGVPANGPSGSGIRLYPNPAKDRLRLELAENVKPADIQHISLYDASGRQVFESAGYDGSVPLKGMAPGLYLVKISLPGSELTQRLIVE